MKTIQASPRLSPNAMNPEAPLNVLLVEDDVDDAEFLEIVLSRVQNPPFLLKRVQTLVEATQLLGKEEIDLVILDLFLPDSKGFDSLLDVMNVVPRTTIVVLTGANDERMALKAINMGAQDYIVKGNLDTANLSRSMRLAVERKRTGIALMESEARLRSVIESALDTIVSLDEDGSILSFNPAGESTFGYRTDEVIGRNIEVLIPSLTCSLGTSNQLPTPDKASNPDSAPPLGRLIETYGRHKNGLEIPLELTLNETKGGSRRLVTGVIRNVTDRRQSEARLRKAQLDLAQAAKMAVLGQMSAGISHELNQPLEALQAYVDNVQLLLREQRYDEVRANFAAISDMTSRAGKIISNIKNLVQHQTQENCPISPQDAIESALSFLQIGNRLEGIDIVKMFPSESVWIMGETVQLEQVFLNLIGNAIDAMQTEERRRLTLVITSTEDEVWVTIRDSGLGIEKQVLSRIFDPFFTTKDQKKGLGLGLAISSSIIREFGGMVEASNHPEGGAQFTLTFEKVSKDMLSRQI